VKPTGMLCATTAPVKYEGDQAEEARRARPGNPDLHDLGQPVPVRGHPNVVATSKIDLRRQEGRGQRQQGQGCQNARAAP
jgi:hypothetical protein